MPPLPCAKQHERHRSLESLGYTRGPRADGKLEFVHSVMSAPLIVLLWLVKERRVSSPTGLGADGNRTSLRSARSGSAARAKFVVAMVCEKYFVNTGRQLEKNGGVLRPRMVGGWIYRLLCNLMAGVWRFIPALPRTIFARFSALSQCLFTAGPHDRDSGQSVID